MKMNWGTKLMIFFGAFVGLILYMVVIASQQNTDLVATDYYAREIAYQDKIDQQEQAGKQAKEIEFNVTSSGIQMHFPKTSTQTNPEGTVIFQRPSDKLLDRDYSIRIDSSGSQLLSLSEFSKGLYNVQVEWKEGDDHYYVKKKLIIP